MSDGDGKVNVASDTVVDRKTKPQHGDQQQSDYQHCQNQTRKAARMSEERNRFHVPDLASRANQRQGYEPNTVVQHLQKDVQRNKQVAGNVGKNLGSRVLRDTPG